MGDKPPRKGRQGFGRTLHPNPDRIIAARLTACPKCQAAFPETSQTPQQVYERIELPPIKPDVTQVRLFGGRCACCGERVVAAAPAGLEPGSPFGQSIAALVVYLHYAHAIGMQRLAILMEEIFSLSLSEGAISNMLARAREPLLVAAATIHATVLASPVVCSDETSARVSGKNWWEWVFIGTKAVLHVIRPSRGKAVVQALFGEIRPMVWVSDMLGSQRGHGIEWRVCLAHLLRDAKYAVECGDTAFSAAFKRLLLRAIAIGRRRDDLKDITLRQYLADLDRRLDRIMVAVPSGEPGTQAAQAHRRQPGASVRFHDQSGSALHEQRLRAASPTQRDLPQSDQRVPLRMGGGNLCGFPVRRQHREGKSRPPCCTFSASCWRQKLPDSYHPLRRGEQLRSSSFSAFRDTNTPWLITIIGTNRDASIGHLVTSAVTLGEQLLLAFWCEAGAKHSESTAELRRQDMYRRNEGH